MGRPETGFMKGWTHTRAREQSSLTPSAAELSVHCWVRTRGGSSPESVEGRRRLWEISGKLREKAIYKQSEGNLRGIRPGAYWSWDSTPHPSVNERPSSAVIAFLAKSISPPHSDLLYLHPSISSAHLRPPILLPYPGFRTESPEEQQINKLSKWGRYIWRWCIGHERPNLLTNPWPPPCELICSIECPLKE